MNNRLQRFLVGVTGAPLLIFPISGAHLPQSVKAALHQKATELSVFTVEPFLKDGWEKWGRVFLDNFIRATAGTGRRPTLSAPGLTFRPPHFVEIFPQPG